MKTNFRFLSASFLLLLTCYACNETFEEQIVLEESQSHGITTVKAQFDEFPELGELYRKTVTEQTRLSKMGQKNSYDFQIDSANVVKKSFENDDYYTFGLIGENDFWPYFENLVIANKEGQEPEAYLFKYSPDDSYLERFQENPRASFSGTIEAEPLDYERLMSSAGGCITYTTEMCNYGGHTNNGLGEGVAGPGCQDTYIVSNTVCFIGPNPFDGGGGGGSGGSGSGGGGGGSSNDSDLPLADSDVITVPAVPIEDLHQLNSDLGFTYASSEATWLRDRDNEDVARALINFLEQNDSDADIAFARNTATGFYLNVLYNITHTLRTKRPKNSLVLSAYPLVKYPFDKAAQYKQDYPKLTEYLMNQLPKVADIPKITSAIYEFTQLPLGQIQKELQWGEGPEVHIVQVENYPGCNTCSEDTVGYFDRANNPDKIFLDIDYVNQLENGNLIENDNDAAIFFIGTTVLHEFVHWGENSNQDFNYDGEEGRKFEIRAYGQNVQPDNARLILNRTN